MEEPLTPPSSPSACSEEFKYFRDGLRPSPLPPLAADSPTDVSLESLTLSQSASHFGSASTAQPAPTQAPPPSPLSGLPRTGAFLALGAVLSLREAPGDEAEAAQGSQLDAQNLSVQAPYATYNLLQHAINDSTVLEMSLEDLQVRLIHHLL